MSAFYDLSKTPRNILNQAIARAIVSENNGAWFDPSDMSTLYQDAAGTTPVTAVEQPAGKIIDKSGNGNHATQSITASRPTLSARYNLLTKTEDFSDAVWVKLRGAISLSGELFKFSEDATLNTHYVYQTITKPANSPISISQVAKAGERKWLRFTLDSASPPNGTNQIRAWFNLETGVVGTVSSVGTYSSATASISKIDADTYICTASGITSSETTCSYLVSPATDNNISSYQGDGVSSIYLGKASATIGAISGPYQRVNTVTDYDTDPRYFPKYLRFDGVDDHLNLPYMGLYAGGEMSIIAARNAVSQSTDTYIISERSITDADPKYFPSRQLASGGNMDAYISDDAATVVLDTVGSAFGGAADKVIRSVVDTGSNLKLYKNGSIAADDNYTRAGTLTLNNTTIGASVSTTTSNYASMKLYGLIITKSALTDAQRVKCEQFLARKAGVML